MTDPNLCDTVDQQESSDHLVEHLVELIFDCEIITVLSSDQLTLMGECARMQHLNPGQKCIVPTGAVIPIAGELLVSTLRAEYPIRRGQFLADPWCAAEGPTSTQLVAESAAKFIWVPVGVLQLFAERNHAFSDSLAVSSYRTALLAT